MASRVIYRLFKSLHPTRISNLHRITSLHTRSPLLNSVYEKPSSFKLDKYKRSPPGNRQRIFQPHSASHKPGRAGPQPLLTTGLKTAPGSFQTTNSNASARLFYNTTAKSKSRSFHTTTPKSETYRRFNSSNTRAGRFIYLLQRWAARPTFYFEIGGIGVGLGVFYIYNLEEVPISGRRRFNIISPEYEAQLSKSQYQAILQQYGRAVLPERDPRTKQVQRVLKRIISANDLLNKGEWTVHVLDTADANAFVIPGGHVFVFAGILPVCADDDGLATVLSHEIGHNLAHHIAESMSRGWLLMPLIYALDIAFGVPANLSNILLTLGFENPGSRRQESEADSIGLMMMAQACYDPRAAVAFWERMEVQSKKMGTEIPQFLSTHPSHGSRERAIEALLPQAQLRRENAGCGSTASYMDSFRGGMFDERMSSR